MFRFEIWNKQDNIGSSTAKEILENNKSFNTNDVLMVYYGDTLSEIQDVEVIRMNERYPLEYTSEQVAQTYVDMLNNPVENDLSVKMDILTEKNNKLEKEQADLLFMLMENNVL